MKYFFPKLIQVARLDYTEEEFEAMTRPLALCPTCNYVLCSCGNCHNSELCNEVCLYEQSEEQS